MFVICHFCINICEDNENWYYVRFQVLTTASMKFRFVFWDVLVLYCTGINFQILCQEVLWALGTTGILF
jgi:hypothetical protein